MSNDNFQEFPQQYENNGIGVAGFVLALLALFLGWIPVLGWVMWLLGLVFSAVGISKARRVKNGMGLSVAGLIISLIWLLLFVVIIGMLGLIGTVGLLSVH
ncbi:hypothetical protein ACG2LH_09675 [Zhouia sp. PK063]|uniref:hypothetical protein n=1 Tax=Zhouia sp. PK063 TaxID=3373602 RepID=UPI003798A074